MNAWKYRGIAPRQTPAMRAERALRNAIGDDAYAAYRVEREAQYRDLIRQVSVRDGKV